VNSSAQVQKLPIGIQSFEKMRTEGFAYVDKTPFIASLVKNGSYYFLSRPRRFGKSLFIDTLDCAFSGRKKLFNGLFLDDPNSGWDWTRIYPVLRIDWSAFPVRTPDDLRAGIQEIIYEWGRKWGCSASEGSLSGNFSHIVRSIHESAGEKVVILIDEYDKPILDTVEDVQTAIGMRDILKDFYGVLKSLDPYLKFVMLTGVSKFVKTGIFSGLNNLNDITLDSAYSGICGYTERDISTIFHSWLSKYSIEQVREWYDGYSWTGEHVYNPFDILLLFSKKVFRPYWFETGTPSFLIKLWSVHPRFPAEYEGLIAGDDLLGSFDPEHIRLETLLFQAGYLTIKTWSSDPVRGFTCVLGYPNLEVRTSLNLLFSDTLLGYSVSESRVRLYEILEGGHADQLKVLIESLFASIPYEWYRKNQMSGFEGFYASILYSWFASLGYEIIAEDLTNKGRIDLTVKTRTGIWIFEFKVSDIPPENTSALEQIHNREYVQKYFADPRKKFLIGITFDPQSRNIIHFESEII
jgi:hypothetical protein